MSHYIREILLAMTNKQNIRNISIISHVDHGKTTLSDHLLQAGGLISRIMAGSARVLDYLDEEQKRGITIKTANISFIYKLNEESFLVNLVDTPGHVDFSGMVSQALRLVDGVIIVIDAVEQVMAQTETVIRQAMKEGLKPLLFINKIDRLINELKLTKEDIKIRISNIIQMTNELINQYAPSQFGKEWKVRVDVGTVIIGSALHGWGISKYSENEPKFEEIIDFYSEKQIEEIRENYPLIEAVLPSVIRNIANPVDSQVNRMRLITKELDKDAENYLSKCDDNEKAVLCIGKLMYDDNRGIISIMRVFSGEVKSGTLIKNVRTGEIGKVHQVCIYKGQSLVTIDSVTAGNIAAIIGIKDGIIGDTFIETKGNSPKLLFLPISYIQEPVISRRVEPRKIADIPKLQKYLEILTLIKPNFSYSYDQNTGEIKIYGIGELQLEIIIGEIEELGIKVEVSEPEVSLVEQIEKEESITIIDALELVEISVLCKPTESESESEIIYKDSRNNILIAEIEEINQGIEEILIIGFKNAILKGPVNNKPIRNITVIISEIKELEKNALRYEILVPLVRTAIYEAIQKADIGVYEPIYSFTITTPMHYLGQVLKITQKFDCEIKDTQHLATRTIIEGKISVESSLRIATELRSASEGYAFWQFQLKGYERKK